MKKRLAFMAVWLLGTVASVVLAWSAVYIVGGQVTDEAGGPLSRDDVARAVAITTLPSATSSSSVVPTRVTMAAPVLTTAPTATTTPTTATPPANVETTLTSPPNGTRQSGGGTIPSETTVPSTPVTPDSGGGGGGGTTAVPNETAPPAADPLQIFHAKGGSAGMRCSGDAAALAFATPTAGWVMSVNDDGPDKVEVEFNDDQGNRSRIIVRCNGGAATVEIKER